MLIQDQNQHNISQQSKPLPSSNEVISPRPSVIEYPLNVLHHNSLFSGPAHAGSLDVGPSIMTNDGAYPGDLFDDD